MPVTIGETGRVVSPLRPNGYVEVQGTRLEAKLAPSKTISLDSGAEVIIVGVDTFGLMVKAVEDVAHPMELPGYGEAIPTPAEQNELREELEKQNQEEEQEEIQRHLQRETYIFVIPLMILFVLGTLAFTTQIAVIMSLAWIVVFFGIGLALSFFGGGDGGGG